MSEDVEVELVEGYTPGAYSESRYKKTWTIVTFKAPIELTRQFTVLAARARVHRSELLRAAMRLMLLYYEELRESGGEEYALERIRELVKRYGG